MFNLTALPDSLTPGDAPVVHVGEIDYRGETFPLLRAWCSAMRRAPHELASALVLPPSGVTGLPAATVTFCVTGCDVPQADSVIEPLLELGAVTRATIKEGAYDAVRSPSAQLPPGRRLITRNTSTRRLDCAARVATEEFRYASPESTVVVHWVAGALGDFHCDATSFAHRDVAIDAAWAGVASAGVAWAGVAAPGTAASHYNPQHPLAERTPNCREDRRFGAKSPETPVLSVHRLSSR